MDHVRYVHTLDCIKYKFEDVIKKIDYTVFRDFNELSVKNGLSIESADKDFNNNVIDEHIILKDNKYMYNVFWLINAGHNVWSVKIKLILFL